MESMRFPRQEIDSHSQLAYSLLQQGEITIPAKAAPLAINNKRQWGVWTIGLSHRGNYYKTEDTLIVSDTMIITGSWSHIGPIYVLDNGVLIIRNADFTNSGSLYISDSGQVFADSSSLSFPQQYPYQNNIFLFQEAYLRFYACTTSFGGYAHYLDIRDSAQMEVQNLYQEDFTSSYIRDRASLAVYGTNLAGEYGVMDSATVNFKDVTELFVYHHFPSSAVIDFSFPQDTDTVYSYIFDDSLPGVDGIGYHIEIDSSYNLRWGILPSGGSDVRITNSNLRIIGLWFEGGDTMDLSGLVNNTYYSDFTLPLSDRTLQLINTSVKSWNIYTFNASNLNLTGSIVGEVISKGHSVLNLSDYFLDGSGGVLTAADTSVLISFLSAINTDIRTEGDASLLLSYSAVPMGDILAMGNSILIVVQSALQEEPTPLDGSVVWFANIQGPSRAYVGDSVPIIGSAWIDRGPENTYYDFGEYQMSYQKVGDSLWTPISSIFEEVREDTLSLWDTRGLEPGNYTLRLVLKNNLGDSVEAMKNINLQTVGISETKENRKVYFNVYPVPRGIVVELSLLKPDFITIKAYDILGRRIGEIYKGELQSGSKSFLWRPSTSGVYFLYISQNGFLSTKKVIWVKR